MGISGSGVFSGRGGGSCRLPWLMREPSGLSRSGEGGGTSGRRQSAERAPAAPEQADKTRGGPSSRVQTPHPRSPGAPGRTRAPPHVVQVPVRVFCPLSAAPPALPAPASGEVSAMGPRPWVSLPGPARGPREGRAGELEGVFQRRGEAEPRSTVTITTKVPWLKEGDSGFTEAVGIRREGIPARPESSSCTEHTPGSGHRRAPPHRQAATLLWKPASWAEGEPGTQPPARRLHRALGDGQLCPLGSWGSFWDRGLANWMHSRVTGETGEGRPSISGLRRPAPASVCSPLRLPRRFPAPQHGNRTRTGRSEGFHFLPSVAEDPAGRSRLQGQRPQTLAGP